MPNGMTPLDKEGCEYGRRLEISVENAREKHEKWCVEMKTELEKLNKKLDKQMDRYYQLKSNQDRNAWVPSLITAVITAVIILFVTNLIT